MQFDQFKHGQKARDNPATLALVGEKLFPTDHRTRRQQEEDFFDFLLDGELLAFDRLGVVVRLGENDLKMRHEVEQRDVGRLFRLFEVRRPSVENVGHVIGAGRQELRGLLELLVLQQLERQFGGRIRTLFPLDPRPHAGKERTGFDGHERGRHHQKLSGNLQVQLLHQVEGGEILFGDVRDRYMVNIEIVFLDQKKQEVQGPFEEIQGHLVGLLGHLNLTARRTASMVFCATARAREAPAARIVSTSAAL